MSRKKCTSSSSPKAIIIRSMAAAQDISLSEIQKKSGVHPSLFYRVVKGEKASRRVDAVIARELGIEIERLRRIV